MDYCVEIGRVGGTLKHGSRIGSKNVLPIKQYLPGWENGKLDAPAT